MLRALIHNWRLNLAVAVAVAVCSAVLTGALLVGDSVRGSLADLTLDRLGQIDLALAADRFFRAELASELAVQVAAGADFDAVVPAILLRGNAQHGNSGARASSVNVLGVDPSFAALFESSSVSSTFARGSGGEPLTLDFARRPRQFFPSVVLNEALAGELAAEVGDDVVVRFRLGAEVPRDSLLGSRETSDVVGTLRGTVVAVLPDRSFGRFDLNPHQTFPLNAYLPVEALQAALEQPDRVNALLVSRAPGGDSAAEPDLGSVIALGDAGLNVRFLPAGPRPAAVVEVQSDEFVLRPAVLNAVEEAAGAAGSRVLRLQAYLANSMSLADRSVPYSMVMAADNPDPGAGFGQLRLRDGAPAPVLGDDEILLGAWAADDLAASVGDVIDMTYYVVGPSEELRTESHSFRVAGVLDLSELVIDPELTPEYPGIEGVEDIALWDPPFPVDLGTIRPRDEAYWDEFGAAPKAFVSEARGRDLWSTRYGTVTSARLTVPAGTDPATFATTLESDLLARLNLAQFGFRFLDVKDLGLEASAGATDFSGLFIGFSFFLILAAALIVGLLFRLGVEQRAPEIGLLAAVGYTAASIRRRLLAEAVAVTALGSAAGLLGAIVYARLLVLGLTTVWLPAVGSPLLFLYVRPLSLAIGWIAAVLVALASIVLTLRRLARVPVTRLLSGSLAATGETGMRNVRRNLVVAGGSAAAGVSLLGFSVLTGAASSPGLAFATGAAFLVAGISAFALWCRSARGHLRRSGAAAAVAMAARNSGWNPGRSVLSVTLVAAACFVIVTVASNTRDPAGDAEAVEHGAGGYRLVATADVPLHGDLNTAAGRFDLGLGNDQVLEQLHVAQLRLLPGDDASCLNLYQPRRPRVLGVPASWQPRSFQFGSTLADELGVTGDPWSLLDVDLGPGVIPALGDANSTQWILHVGVGDDVVLEDEAGEPLRLRIVGVLRESVFQSELLVSEANLLRHFPSLSGFSYFLVDAPAGREAEVARTLEDGLARFGFDATTSGQKLAGFLVVQNTYLSTFLMLGGLGLLLGTVGLGVILLRNVIERRGELATLRAFGFRRSFLSRMVLAENAFLLLVGVAVGAGSGLLAVAPRFLLGALELPWSTLAATLGAVLVVGMLASVVAVAGALRIPLLPALKSER